MTTPESLPIVPRPSTAIVKRSAGAETILARMTSDILDLAQAHATAIKGARFKIGAYELREADYQQILLWAQALALPPLTVITHLANSVCENFGGDPPASRILFALDDGAITSLAWDFEKLPLKIFQWVTGLRVEQLGFMGTPASSPALALHLPFLSVLCCRAIRLTELDLSNVPALTELYCSQNQLTELDLSNVPELTKLYCWENQLTELDLSNVPALTNLYCRKNQLTELDLSNVPELTELACWENQLTELDLSNVPALTKLYCWENQLTELDLSNVPALTELYCSRNQLTELDLSNVPALTKLKCWVNQLTTLDIRTLPNLGSFGHDPQVIIRKRKAQNI